MNEYAIAAIVGTVIIIAIMVATGVVRTIVNAIVSLFTGGDFSAVPKRAGRRRGRRR